ncbi:MAG: purine-binding chemotaxis protein CheW [Candidatus Latescibacteria bacterium]|nr:purine-binding chemotaxis protein CheW [Candidatus Latescibacterota bacterium]
MSRQITTFSVADTLLGLDILIVKEVYRHMDLTPVPDAPPHMSGLMNLRGRVVTVVDFGACLNLVKEEPHEKKLLIMKTNAEILKYQQKGLLADVSLGDDIVGFLIDDMDEVLTVEDEDVLPTPPNLDTVDRQLIEGVVKLKNKLVLILDINAILERILSLSTSTGEQAKK